MKIVYIAETSLTNNSAYTHHVIKMCDAFSQMNQEVVLYIPKLHKSFQFEEIKKIFIIIKEKI